MVISFITMNKFQEIKNDYTNSNIKSKRRKDG